MAFIDWLPNYDIGHKTIDEQHKHLVGMVNKLHDSISRNKIDIAVAEVLKEIVEYTQYHFDAEERVMHESGFPAVKNHMVLHRNLIHGVAGKLAKLNRGEQVSVFEMMAFLREWLVNHILKEDKKFAAHLEEYQIMQDSSGRHISTN